MCEEGRFRASSVVFHAHVLAKCDSWTKLLTKAIPTRLLGAYALPLAPLAPFNGVLQDCVLLNPNLFRGLYATAHTACI